MAHRTIRRRAHLPPSSRCPMGLPGGCFTPPFGPGATCWSGGVVRFGTRIRTVTACFIVRDRRTNANAPEVDLDLDLDAKGGHLVSSGESSSELDDSRLGRKKGAAPV